ncbi:MAG: DUF427 domain-containing protein [Chloroflexota bacterium]
MSSQTPPRRLIGRTRVFAGSVPPPTERIVPGPGQESVWDYPRPPRVEPLPERIRVVHGGITLADTTNALRVLETAGAPVYYLPPADVRTDLLRASEHGSVCEFKGLATYHSIVLPAEVIPNAGWSYPEPLPGYEVIRDHLAFYAWRVDEAWVGGERAEPQPGRFYGGWITARIVGPFKGGWGTFGW